MIIPGVETLNDANFLIYATKVYDNPRGVTKQEFEDELKRIKYTKRLLNRYLNTGVLRERFILNHLIVLRNCFGTEHAVRMLFFKLEENLYPALKTFLVFLDYMPEIVSGIDGKSILSSDIPLDRKIITILRKIEK